MTAKIKQIDPKKYFPQPISRYLSDISIRAVDGEESNKFEISFSSETPCRRWGEYEILLHGRENVKLDKLKTAGVLLYAHGRDSKIGNMPIGGIEDAKLDETKHRCTATIVLDEDDEDAMKIAGKIRKGYISGISVGYYVKEWIVLQKDEKSADGRFKGPAVLANLWEPFEISIEPLPADTTVGIGRSMINENYMEVGSFMNENGEIVRTGDGEGVVPAVATPAAVPAAPGTPIAVPAASAQRSAEEILEAERKRASSIMKRCAAFNLDAESFISRGLTMEEVNEEIVRTMEGQRKPIPAGSGVIVEERDKFCRAASDSLLLRGGVHVEAPADGSREMRGMRLRDLAIECAGRDGVTRAGRLSNDDLFRAVMQPDSAFVGIVSDTVRGSMAVAYAAADTTYQYWTSKGSNPDFKPTKRYQISEAGDLDEIPQNGEFKMDYPTDNGVTTALATFGKKFGFTRKALINDEIGLLTNLPAAYVRSAKRGVNRAVYKILQSNPTMEDGNALFSAAHKNLGTASKPNTASYQEAMGNMMHQKGLRGMETLNIRPKFIICDPLQYAEHAAMIRSLADPSSNNAGKINPFSNMFELIMDADLLASTSGALPYFFAAAPTDCGTIEVSYLNGQEEPQLDWRMGFDFLGIEYRIVHDRGITLLDYRGLSKNPGSTT